MQSLNQNSSFTMLRSLPRLVFLIAFFIAGFMQRAEALYLDQSITAYSIPHNGIKIDGRPDALWKSMASYNYSYSTISFNDYSKIVLLQADSIRNANPQLFFTAPSQGSINFFAAYDDSAFYFFFLIKENSRFNSTGLCNSTSLWKAHAAEVYLDPSPWNTDNYGSYFSADGSGLLNGTSPKTIQIDKPIDPKYSGQFFRNRTPPQDRFQTPTILPKGIVTASSVHSLSDSLLIGVEMKIPFWTGTGADFLANKHMFISWGYNHYPDAGKNTCDSTPIAYRWAKHYKRYSAQDANKPIGWRAGDSTHFDPTRSWDGWGEFNLSSQMAQISGCNFTGPDSASWDLKVWKSQCQIGTTSISGLKGGTVESNLNGKIKTNLNLNGKASIPWRGIFWNPQGRVLNPNLSR